MHKHAIFVDSCLLLLAALIYSRLTGYDLGLHKLAGNSSKLMANTLFYLYILFILISLGILHLKKIDSSAYKTLARGANLLISCIIFFCVIFVISYTFLEIFAIGRAVRFYMVPHIVYFLPAIVAVVIILFRKERCLDSNFEKFSTLGIASLAAGLILYAMKLQFAPTGNINSILQLLLVALCLVFPSFYFILGVIDGLTKHKYQRNKWALFATALGAIVFPLLSALV